MSMNKLNALFKLSSNAHQGMLYGASIALMKGMSLIMLPFIANHLSPEQFGRLEVISTLAVIGSILVGMGLEDTLFRFAGSEKSISKRRNIASEIFSLTLLIGFITLLIGYYIAPLITPSFPGQPSVYEVRIVLAVLALEGCIAIPLGWLRMNNRALTFFVASTGRAIIQALLVLTFLSLDRAVTGILEAGLIAAICQTLFLSVLQLADTPIKFNLNTCKRSLVYSLPIVASGLVAFALNGMDRWILAEYATLIDVAQFGIAAKFALAMVLLMQPFGMWWSPRRFEVLNGINGQQQVVKYISLGAIIAIMITVSVSLISPTLIYWILPESYQHAIQYVVAIAVVMLLKELVELFNIGCFNGKTTSSQLFINLFATAIGVLAMLWLTPEFKVWGVICSLIAAQFIRLLLFYKVSQHYLPLNFPIIPLLLFALLASLWLLIGTLSNIPSLSVLVLVCAMGSLLMFAHYLRIITLPTQLIVNSA